MDTGQMEFLPIKKDGHKKNKVATDRRFPVPRRPQTRMDAGVAENRRCAPTVQKSCPRKCTHPNGPQTRMDTGVAAVLIKGCPDPLNKKMAKELKSDVFGDFPENGLE